MIECLECGAKLNVIKHTHLRFKCTGTLRNVEEYKAKYPGAETTSVEVRKKIGQSEETYIARLGEELGKQKWKEYCKKLSVKNSFEFMNAKKGWTYEQWEAYNKSRAVTLENLSKKYGHVEGEKRWKTYCEKQVKAGNKLEHFIEKHGEIDGPLEYARVCQQKGITLENMIRVHGSEQGVINYNKWLEATKGNYISGTGEQFIRELVEQLPSYITFHDGIYSKEFCVYKERPYLYDFVITHPYKLCIEFNGDFWHANPDKYQATDIVQHRGKHVIAREIWERDKIKNDIIRERGYDVLIIWESEYLANKSETIKKVLEWINTHEHE